MEKEIGVCRIERIVNGKYDRRWVARWFSKGKRKSRSYSINKFGEEGAHKRALRTRNKAEIINQKEIMRNRVVVI